MTDDARAKAVEAAVNEAACAFEDADAAVAYALRNTPTETAMAVAIAAYERAMAEAGWVMAERKLLAEAHACMRATGWQLAMASDVQGDGVLQAAVSDVEGRFAAMLAGRAGEEG